MQKIDWRKLAVMLLPMQLRQPVMMSVMRTLMQPIVTLSDSRSQQRDKNLFNLQHSGQVCSLRHALNTQFGFDRTNGFEIEDIRADGDYLMIYDENSNQTDMIPISADEQAIKAGYDDCRFLFVWDETTIWATQDFIVWCPQAVYDDPNRLLVAQSVVEQYRLPSRRADYRKLTR